MTGTPNPLLGERVVWVICTGADESTCSNYIPADPNVPTTADWGSASASFGEVEAYRLYGKRISPLLINRILDPDWIDDGDPDNIQDIVEQIVPTYTVRVEIDTSQRDQIHPAIELYDGVPSDGSQSVAGIIDGTYYVYPVVFQDAEFCYIPRCSGQYPNNTDIEICLSGEGTFPLEPHDPDCTPLPVYPMDAITKWSPSPTPYHDITYSVTWSYYRGSSPSGTLETATINAVMRVYPPNNDWTAMEAYMKAYTYFYNGIYH